MEVTLINPMKKITFYLTCICFCVFATSCTKKPTACINEYTNSVKVGDTIKITSCSSDADTYIWEIDGGFLNYFNDPFFGKHFVVSGGEGCDNWIELSFFSPGTYSIDLTNPVLKKGACYSAEMEWSKKDNTSIFVTVVQ